MSIETQFFRNGSTYGAGQGGNAANLESEREAIIGNFQQSKLHAYSIGGPSSIPGYSLDGTPTMRRQNLPSPSILDLNGVTPPQYRDNAPPGATSF